MNMQHPDATCAAGEILLKNFTPLMGSRYENGRNTDRGPGMHHGVSMLSPYLRRRLVTERDAVASALGAHGQANAGKFIQEVIWRGYFKGWMECHPKVWAAYRECLEKDLFRLAEDRSLRCKVDRAEGGGTGVACFDAWVQELVETGYLHNHARMWFASIWIFTFGLPWRLGADFFYRHLLDGDPASNTLSWRWVAGLHTRGKPYEAKAANIAKFTDGRFAPLEKDLATDIKGLEHLEPRCLSDMQPLRNPLPPNPNIPTAFLITEEDCQSEDFAPLSLDIRAAATLSASHLRSPRDVSTQVASFEAGALSDAADRAGLEVENMRADEFDSLVRFAERTGTRQIVTPYLPVGPLRDWFDKATPALDAVGVTLAEWRRDWDTAIWPHAMAGFFRVKKKIPLILHEVGLT
jgi:deoxyribodipyrimidine photo-lyase